MRVDFDGSSYASAGRPLADGGEGVGRTVTALSGALAGSARMAGDHVAGRSFAAAYDAAAVDLVRAGCAVATAMASMGVLVDVAAYNHALADAHSHPKGLPVPALPSTHVERVVVSTPPSVTGGTGQEPSWWQHVIDVVPGLEWPDADTGRLRAAADAWEDAARGFDACRWSCASARGLLEASRSPEVPTGLAAIGRLDGAVGLWAGQARAMASQCRVYAEQVEASRHAAEATMVGVLAGLTVTAVVGIGFTLVTFGGSDVVAAEAAAAEVAAGAAAVSGELAAAAAVGEGAAAAVTGVASTAVEVAAVAAPFEAASVEVASVTAASEAGAGASAGSSGLLGRLGWTAFNGVTYTQSHAQGIGELVMNPTHTIEDYRAHATVGGVAADLAEAGMMFVPGGAGKTLNEAREAHAIEEGTEAAVAADDLAALRRCVTPEMLATPTGRARLADEITARARQHAENITDTTVTVDKSFTKYTYKKGFRDSHPELDIAQVHHTIEQQLAKSGLFANEEIHALANLRGIESGPMGTAVHQGVIRIVYNNVYRMAVVEGRALTRADVLGAVRAIDEVLGRHFIPPAYK